MDPSCIFCRIVAKTLPSQVVYEDDRVLGIRDINPQAPVHILVMPKTHIENLQALGAGHEPAEGVMEHVFSVINKLAMEAGLAHPGYRVVVNTGQDGGQTVAHLHLHLLGGRRMAWPPG